MEWALKVVVEESPDELEFRKRVEESLKGLPIFEYIKRREEELKEVPSFKLRKRIEEDLGHITIFDDEPGLLRFKLKYLPVILTASMETMRADKVKSLEDAITILKNVELKGLSDYYPYMKSLKHSDKEIIGKWKREDAENLDKLLVNLPIKPKLVERTIEREEIIKHLAWPVCVLELEEVRKEIDFLLNEPFLTMDNGYDNWVVEKAHTLTIGASGGGEIKGAEAINITAKRMGKVFHKIIESYRKLGIDFWFTLFYLSS